MHSDETPGNSARRTFLTRTVAGLAGAGAATTLLAATPAQAAVLPTTSLDW
ncbi:nitrous oxide reductase [Kitasatospora sp. MAP12-15]|nr:nitrous oxide reductase [Kitasatospora sp. MAP12-44]